MARVTEYLEPGSHRTAVQLGRLDPVSSSKALPQRALVVLQDWSTCPGLSSCCSLAAPIKVTSPPAATIALEQEYEEQRTTDVHIEATNLCSQDKLQVKQG